MREKPTCPSSSSLLSTHSSCLACCCTKPHHFHARIFLHLDLGGGHRVVVVLPHLLSTPERLPTSRNAFVFKRKSGMYPLCLLPSPPPPTRPPTTYAIFAQGVPGPTPSANQNGSVVSPPPPV
ncbi:Hypothetical predicted protein [Podarcis lilfordi]|uniref:Uncharacterized protein n=1 Tax=Podarcis lilfordi TaxID=74358 RepID=A0AA35LE79_9SAUR|nr:Hypothetical predicted protein [Podarcis lilfordi]